MSSPQLQEIINHIKAKINDGSWSLSEIKKKAQKNGITSTGDVMIREYSKKLYDTGFRRQFIPEEKTFRLIIVSPSGATTRYGSPMRRSPSPTNGGGRLSPTRGSGYDRAGSPTRGSGYDKTHRAGSPTRGSGYDRAGSPTRAGNSNRYSSPTKAGHWGEDRYVSPTRAGTHARQTSPTRGAGGRRTSGGAESDYALRPNTAVVRRLY